MSEGTGPNTQGPAKPGALEGRPDPTIGSSSHLAVRGEVGGRAGSSLPSHSGQHIHTSIPGGTKTDAPQAGMGMAPPVPHQGPHKETLQIILLALDTKKTKRLNFHLKLLHISTKHEERPECKKVVLMLVNGIDPNFKMETQIKVTPLYAEAEAGPQEIYHMLIQAAARLNMCDEEDQQPTALMMKALENTSGAMMSTHRGVEGFMCLHLEAESGHYNVVENLLCGLVDFCQEENGAVFSDSGDMDARCDLQATVHRGDSPLHNAAPEDRLEGVMLFFLSGGLDVNLKNGVFTPRAPTVWWVILQANLGEWEAQYLPSPKNAERLLHRDISQGQERVPINCVNSVDGDSYPDDYEYIPECCVTSPINIDRKITHLQNCVCEENCSASICLYDEEISLRCWYDKGGCLLPEFYLEDPPFIFECNQACCCGTGCKNRVVQHGQRTRLQLFKTNMKGWGVRALEDIPQWTFVCQYVGEIISETEALMREDDTFILSLDCHRDQLEESYCVDSLFYGNISRFFNHMCEPNLFPCRVFTSHQDLRFPHVAFFTCSDVKAGDELGFDYGDAYWQDKGRYFSCECGSPKCKHSASAMMTYQQEDTTPEE